MTLVDRVDRLARALLVLTLGWAVVRPVYHLAVEVTAEHPTLPLFAVERALWSICLAAASHELQVLLVLVVVGFLAGVTALLAGARYASSAWLPAFGGFALLEISCHLAGVIGLHVPVQIWLPVGTCSRIAFLAMVVTAQEGL